MLYYRKQQVYNLEQKVIFYCIIKYFTVNGYLVKLLTTSYSSVARDNILYPTRTHFCASKSNFVSARETN